MTLTDTTARRSATTAPHRGRFGLRAWRWLTTTDHQTIGNFYFITSFGFFLFGGVLALAMRAERPNPACSS